MKHLLLLIRPTRVKKLWVEADNYIEAVNRATFRYPGVFVNYSNARRGNLWEVHKQIIKAASMKIFSSHPNNIPLIEAINEMINETGPVLLSVEGVKVFLLVSHYKYLNPKLEAKRMRLGTVTKTDEGLYYFYEPVEVSILKPAPKTKKVTKALKSRGKKK